MQACMRHGLCMGNNPSNVKQGIVNPGLLGPPLVCDEAYTHDVTMHHTTQKQFKRCKVLRLTQADRRNELRAKLVQQAQLTVCLEQHFQITDLMKTVALPLKCKHPSILSVYSSLPDPVQNALFLIVEDCIPLRILLDTLDAYQIVLGIRSLLLALDFIHSQLRISHNNVRVNSVFIDSQSRWKISGFELALPFKEMNENVHMLLELLKKEKLVDPNAFEFHRNYPFGYDMFCLGRLVSQLSSYRSAELSELPAFGDFVQVIRKSCLSGQPQFRLPASHLLAHAIFQHPLLLATDFLDNYMGHSDAKKTEFFSSFTDLIASRLPMAVLCKQILPRLFESNIFLDSPSRPVIVQLLQPSGPYPAPFPGDAQPPSFQSSLSSSSTSFLPCLAFQDHLAPWVLGKWRHRERGTRLLLLGHFETHFFLFSRMDLRETILPQVCIGVYDQHDDLAGLSLSALSALTRVFGVSTVLDTLRTSEVRLKQAKCLPPVVAAATVATATAATRWPRGHLFAETAPKLSRQSREIPVSEQRSERQRLSLAQLATLSGHYEPSSNAVLREACYQEMASSSSRPSRLSDGLVKITSCGSQKAPEKKRTLSPNGGVPTTEKQTSVGANGPDLSYSNDTVTSGQSEARAQSVAALSCVADKMRYNSDKVSESDSDGGNTTTENCWDVSWDF